MIISTFSLKRLPIFWKLKPTKWSLLLFTATNSGFQFHFQGSNQIFVNEVLKKFLSLNEWVIKLKVLACLLRPMMTNSRRERKHYYPLGKLIYEFQRHDKCFNQPLEVINILMKLFVKSWIELGLYGGGSRERKNWKSGIFHQFLGRMSEKK